MNKELEERNTDNPPEVIQGLFFHQDAIARHLAAPMLSERENYLGKLLASGYKRQLVADRASMLCYLVTSTWFAKPIATEDDILKACAQWRGYEETHPSLRHSGKAFIAAARSWTKFLGSYVAAPRAFCRFEDAYLQFLSWLRQDLGFLESSINSCAAGLRSFLIWISPSSLSLSSISLIDVDAFIAERRSAGRSRQTIISQCLSLRTFFRFAELRGWSRSNLSKTIRAPSQRVIRPSLRCPPWPQIRRTLTALDGPNPSHCRARAVLFLASVYGLRRSEIGRLTLEDLDWQHEVLTVRRSKRGRTQQFPIQFEVGEALIRYLRVRPKSTCRTLFLTLHSPSRPALSLSSAIRKVLLAQQTFDKTWGLHAFRHACATELLRKGTSLRGIADFLGHRGIASVTIYAHSDLRALREVARIDLKEFRCD